MSSENLTDAPTGEFQDNSYVSRSGNKAEPLAVQSDDAKIEDPIDPNIADTDEQLGMYLPFCDECSAVRVRLSANWSPARDDNEAIDKGNIIDERTRGAGKPSGTYREPGDDEGIPTDDGTSAADQVKPQRNTASLR